MAIKKLLNVAFIIITFAFSIFVFLTSEKDYLIIKATLAIILMVLAILWYKEKSKK